VIRNGHVHAACLLGDLGPADQLQRLFSSGAEVPQRRLEIFFPPLATAQSVTLADLPDTQQICDCNGVNKGTIVAAIRAGKCTLPAVGKATRAGTGCGSCKKMIKGLIECYADSVTPDPSEDWYVPAVPMDKPTLVAEIRRRGLKSVSAVLRELGQGEDEKSKNGLASLLKSL
jgi:nitrite reductase (NADH) large subunit